MIEFSELAWLQAAYVANILILVPVCAAMWSGRGAALVFSGGVSESPGLERLVASLWSAILVASLAGLAFPALFAPLIMIQVIYKALWLATYAFGPRGGLPFPGGIAASFIAIVIGYPVLFALAL